MPAFELPAQIAPSLPVPVAPLAKFKPQPNKQRFTQPWIGPSGIPLVPDEHTISSGADTRIYECIARNPVVKAALDARMASVFESKYDIVSRNDYRARPEFEAIDLEIIKSVREQWALMGRGGWDAFLRTCWRNGVTYGFVIGEKIPTKRDGLNVIEAMNTIAPFEFMLWVNALGVLSSVQYLRQTQIISADGLAALVVAPYPQLSNGNYYGVSEMASIRHDVLLLEALERKLAQGAAHLMEKPIVYWYDASKRNSSQVRLTQSNLAAAGSATAMSFPVEINPQTGEMIKYDYIEVLADRASAEGAKHVREMVLDLRRQINFTLGIPEDGGLTQTVGGSRARAEEQNRTIFDARVTLDQEFLVDLVNRQVIPDMWRFNYPALPDGYKPPEFTFLSLEEDATAYSIDSIERLVKIGAVQPNEPWIRESAGVPPAPAVAGEEPKSMEVGKATSIVMDLLPRVNRGDITAEQAQATLVLAFGMSEDEALRIVGTPTPPPQPAIAASASPGAFAA